MPRTEEQKAKHREYMREWSRNNPDKVRANNQRRLEKDPEAERARVRADYHKNKGVRRAQQAQYRETNADAIVARKRETREKNPAHMLLTYAKQRANKYGIPLNITVEDCEVPTHCPVLGIELKVATGKVAPYSPTLDRVIPELGYTKGNVIVVSHMANTIKNAATVEQLKKVAYFYDCWTQAQQLK